MLSAWGAWERVKEEEDCSSFHSHCLGVCLYLSSPAQAIIILIFTSHMDKNSIPLYLQFATVWWLVRLESLFIFIGPLDVLFWELLIHSPYPILLVFLFFSYKFVWLIWLLGILRACHHYELQLSLDFIYDFCYIR